VFGLTQAFHFLNVSDDRFLPQKPVAAFLQPFYFPSLGQLPEVDRRVPRQLGRFFGGNPFGWVK
jgi:hypothetical protein